MYKDYVQGKPPGNFRSLPGPQRVACPTVTPDSKLVIDIKPDNNRVILFVALLRRH